MQKELQFFDEGLCSAEKILLASGRECGLFLPGRTDNWLVYDSEECQYTPAGWVVIDGCWFPLGYKVVNSSLSSLGLRKNPNIMTFPVGEWIILEDNQITVDKDDWGGIWTARKRAGAKSLKNYCLSQYQRETRIFLAAVLRPVYANSYRVKSQGVMLLEELN